MTTVVERESTVSRVVGRKTIVQPQAQDSLLQRASTRIGVAIFYGVLLGVSPWNFYRVIARIFR
jgi:hypothetical protein